MKSIAFGWVEGVMVMVESGRAIADAEWDEYIAELMRGSGDEWRLIVAASSSPPTAGQRAKLKSATGSRKMRVAVMSDSVVTRAAIAAFSLFLSGVQGFRADAYDAALEYLNVPRSSRSNVERTIARFRQSVSVAG